MQYVGYQDSAQVYDVTAGSATFAHGTSATGTVGGTVPATLSLGGPASFGAFTPGVAKTVLRHCSRALTSMTGGYPLGRFCEPVIEFGLAGR